MDIERFNSAYRLAIGLVLLYVLWMLVPAVLGYVNLVVSTRRHSQTVTAAQQTEWGAADVESALRQATQKVDAARRLQLSAVSLESALRHAKQFGPNSQLRCVRAGRDWDYVCSYMPTPLQSATVLQFGVNVDATRWVKVSRVVPMGTTLPAPQ